MELYAWRVLAGVASVPCEVRRGGEGKALAGGAGGLAVMCGPPRRRGGRSQGRHRGAAPDLRAVRVVFLRPARGEGLQADARLHARAADAAQSVALAERAQDRVRAGSAAHAVVVLPELADARLRLRGAKLLRHAQSDWRGVRRALVVLALLLFLLLLRGARGAILPLVSVSVLSVRLGVSGSRGLVAILGGGILASGRLLLLVPLLLLLVASGLLALRTDDLVLLLLLLARLHRACASERCPGTSAAAPMAGLGALVAPVPITYGKIPLA
mmetsp:Transcript_98331/g.212029  ORF Transcript_98331/g.212029 Transcript_98331/m.212029 type:complete len:271 (-) Transcript_98331:12-824(-)